MKAYFRSLIAVALLTGGCASQLPIASNFPLSTQKKLRSSHHWEIIADDVANQTLRATTEKKLDLAGKPLYLQAPADSTPFNKAFRNFLITRMVNRGIKVSKSADTAQEVQYELQLVRHNSNRYTHVPGTFTALTAGVSVLRDIFAGGSAALPASLGVSGLVDFGIGYYGGGATNTELIITTSILQNGSFTMRKSDIYYIEDADAGLFVDALERPGKQWDVVGN